MLLNGELKPAVFLDRDGVVNRAEVRDGLPYAPTKLRDLVILDGVKQSVELLSSSGFELVVITNQPDVSRGIISKNVIDKMHQIITAETGLEHFYVCFHEQSENCNCRKPNTGLLIDAVNELGIDLTRSFLIGDRWKDIQAGQDLGCECFFIDNNYLEQYPKYPFDRVHSLSEATRIILEKINGK